MALSWLTLDMSRGPEARRRDVGSGDWFERRATDPRKTILMNTNNTKFTPGPWACKLTGDRKHWILGDGQSTWGTEVGTIHRDDIDRDEAEANATLIRNAPEMFAMLAKCAGHLGKEIERKTLNESAADGTQALSREVAALLDAVAAPPNTADQRRSPE